MVLSIISVLHLNDMFKETVCRGQAMIARYN